MCKEDRVGNQVTQANDVADMDTLINLTRQRLGRQDLPVVIGIVVWISRNLLALRRDAAILVTQWVAIRVTVKIHLSLLVAHSNGIVIVDSHRLQCHLIVAQCLLELGCHEVIAWS